MFLTKNIHQNQFNKKNVEEAVKFLERSSHTQLHLHAFMKISHYSTILILCLAVLIPKKRADGPTQLINSCRMSTHRLVNVLCDSLYQT